MKINWKKVIIDILKVVIGAIAGASATGCILAPIL